MLLAPEIIYFSANFWVSGQDNVLSGAARFVNTPACGAPGPGKKQGPMRCFDHNINWSKQGTSLEAWGSETGQPAWLRRLAGRRGLSGPRARGR